MSVSEEDSYSMIFGSLKHPIRRGILRILSDHPESFSDLQKQFKIESSHLTYHIEGLGNLIYKTQDGKYALSSLGEGAVSTMKHVEEPPMTSLRLPLPSIGRLRMIKPLTGILVCGLIVSMIFNGVFLLRNSELDKAHGGLNNMYDELKGAYDGLNTTYSEMDKAYDELNATYFSLMPRAMGFQSISMGDGNGGFYGRLVIRNLSKWDEVWNAVQLRCSSYVPNSTGCHSVPPYVDFSKNVVVAVSTFGATSGYGVEVEEIWDVGQYVLVEVKRTYPSQGCITLQMTTNPYHFVMMPRTSKPIMFNTTEVPLICGD